MSADISAQNETRYVLDEKFWELFADAWKNYEENCSSGRTKKGPIPGEQHEVLMWAAHCKLPVSEIEKTEAEIIKNLQGTPGYREQLDKYLKDLANVHPHVRGKYFEYLEPYGTSIGRAIRTLVHNFPLKPDPTSGVFNYDAKVWDKFKEQVEKYTEYSNNKCPDFGAGFTKTDMGIYINNVAWWQQIFEKPYRIDTVKVIGEEYITGDLKNTYIAYNKYGKRLDACDPEYIAMWGWHQSQK